MGVGKSPPGSLSWTAQHQRRHTCAREASGSVVCWGDNSAGQLGDGTVTDHLTPGPVSASSRPLDALELTANADHTCARLGSGGVVCWGSGSSGLGDGTAMYRLTPTPVSDLVDAVELAAGWNHTCARRSSGTVACWGNNAYGLLGDGTSTNRLVPTLISGVTDAVALGAASRHGCAVRGSGGLVCWGLNSSGQLGDGTTTDRWTPTSVVEP